MRIMVFILCLALSVVAVTLAPLPASAAPGDNQREEAASDTGKAAAAAREENPYQNQLRAAALKLSKTIGKDELEALNQLRSGFGMVRAVRITQESVEEAVPLCAEANPDLGEKITARYAAWKEAVGPALDKAEQEMGASLASGAFRKTSDIRQYLDLTDKAARAADEQTEKKVVTTPEACRNLLTSMDTTEEQLTGLLKNIEWPQKKAAPGKAEAPPKAPAADVGKHDKKSLPDGEREH